jgi:hypothetical protein
MKKTTKRSLTMNDLAWEPIDEIGGCDKCLVSKFERHGGMGKEGEADLNYVTVFPLCRAVLLVSMRARHMMGDSNALEKGA